jgi:uncharacterized protein YjlB
MKAPKKIYFQKANDVPNSQLPVLVFRSALPQQLARKAEVFRKTFKSHGWKGVWTDTIYDYTHFHSNAHEVLGIAEGKVALKLGGSSGRIFHLKAGDVVVLPAGTGHGRIGSDEGLKVVGAYPAGQERYDIKRKGKKTPNVPLPHTDPLSGIHGALAKIWAVVSSNQNKR